MSLRDAGAVGLTSSKTMGLRLMRRILKIMIPLLAIGLITGFNTTEVRAQAQGLATVGPTDPGNGYPQYYQDKGGLALEPCLANTAVGDPCAIAADVPIPGQPIVFPTNFPDEFFNWTANERIRPLAGSNNFRADLTLALEGAFGGATGGGADGGQIVCGA